MKTKPMELTVEDTTLISGFDHSSRLKAYAELLKAQTMTEDADLKDSLRRTADKLAAGTDEEFDRIAFEPDGEDDE